MLLGICKHGFCSRLSTAVTENKRDVLLLVKDSQHRALQEAFPLLQSAGLPVTHVHVEDRQVWSQSGGSTSLHSAPRVLTRAVQHVKSTRGQFLMASNLQQDMNLSGKPLQPCSGPGENTTGVFRSGSCAWDPNDAGYHEVCVQMAPEFLKKSAEKDDNDLTSVVKPGDHWCICAWAFAGAVARDPTNYEGIRIDCDRTNAKLREVYKSVDTLTGPSGISYSAKTALEHLDKLCPPK
jgi:uncharacterized protein (DUF2237 family)